jgi:hypothetical protein
LSATLEFEAAVKSHQDLKHDLSGWIKKFTATNGRAPDEEKDASNPVIANKFTEYAKVSFKV